MTQERLIAVGDIHGCLDELKELIGLINPTEEDTLVFLGDYIDRGPNSRGVIEYLAAFKNKFKNTVFLMGNHEDMWVNAFESLNKNPVYTGSFELAILNGGSKYIKNYDLSRDDIYYILDKKKAIYSVKSKEEYNQLPEELRTKFSKFVQMKNDFENFYCETKLWYEKDNYVFVHAGIPIRGEHPSETEEGYNRQDLMWIRDEFIHSPHELKNKLVVFGHTPEISGYEIGTPAIMEDKICLDTACVFGYNLTAMDVKTKETWQVAKKG